MEWTCTECGASACSQDALLLTTMGWRVTGDGECVCAPCVRNASSDPAVKAAREMRERAAQIRVDADVQMRVAQEQRRAAIASMAIYRYPK